jgi:hypothetical protein
MEKRMSADSGMKTWETPRLDQLPMVDTTFKGEEMSEDSKLMMAMAPVMQS